MAGLDPAIHVLLTDLHERRGCPAQGRAWRDRETRKAAGESGGFFFV